MPRKKLFKSSHPQSSSSSSKTDVVYCELYFDRLPTEILVEIVKLLTPVDIYNFLKVCSPRCAEAAYDLKTVSYEACRRVESEHVLVFFNSICPTNIVEINFNNVCHTTGPELMSVIVKCKQLITLSVINCGISISNVVTILQQCEKIENFSWDVHYPVIKRKDYSRGFRAPQLKNMFLVLNKTSEGLMLTDILHLLNIVISLCPADVNMYFNYSNVPIFHPLRLCYTFHRNLKVPISCFSDLYQISCIWQHKSFIHLIMTTSDDLPYFESTKSIPLFFTKGLSYLQFRYIEAESFCLEDFPISDTESLSILLDYMHPPLHPTAIKEHLKSLKWPKLKNVSIQDGTKDEQEIVENLKRSAFEVSPLLSLIMLNAPNITTLNFSGIHVELDLPIEHIRCLKCLAAISIPTCGMRTELSSGEEESEGGFAFLEIITTCTEVKHFSLTRCIVCSDGPGEKQLMYLKNWKKLMDLSVSNVPALRVCTFLRAVADSCADLRALHLTSLGHKSVCHYIPNVIYVLRTSKRLQLLRLNQEAFHLENSLFWKAIKSAINLESLCIASASNSFPPVRQMISSFKELKFLYILHLKMKNLPKIFESRVRQVFLDHEVKTPQISIKDPGRNDLLCALYHFGYPCFHDIVE